MGDFSFDADGQMVLAGSIDVSVGGMCIEGDSLYYYGATLDATGRQIKAFGIIDLQQKRIVDQNPLQEPADNPIKTPYGITVHPETHDIFVMDATNYVSSGKLYCFDRHGQWKWAMWTGDIPAHTVFVPRDLKADFEPEDDTPKTYSKYILNGGYQM